MSHAIPALCLKSKLFLFSFFFNILCFVCLNLFCLDNIPEQTKPHGKPCEDEKESPPVIFQTNLLILILVSPTSVKSRETIRKTWAHAPPNDSMIKFVIGAKEIPDGVQENLSTEQEINGDIVYLDNFKESYEDLTKKLLQSFVWAANNVKFSYLLKADEDSFVRIDQVLVELKNKPSERFYWGFFDGRAPVKKSGKYVEKSYVLCDRYLPYALGGGYVISSDLVGFVSKNADYLKLYKNEDVSLGTWLAPLDIVRSHDPRFDTEYKSRGCSNSYLVTHKQGHEDMRQMYSNLKNFNKLCIKEFQKRFSYDYNWSVEPSKCCLRSKGFV